MTFSGVSIKQVEKYWDERPCNIRHSPREVGSREYFDEVEARKYFVEPHIPHFAEFERWTGKRVLEIGCGIGTDTINFARSGALVTAVDLSDESLKIARKRAEVFNLSDSIDFRQADAESLSEVVPPEPYDFVYSFGVIHHTPHPERVLEQVRSNYVRSRSIVKVMVYNRYSWKVLGILLGYGRGQVWKLDQLVAEHSEAQTGSPITYTLTPRQARSLFLAHGFSRVKTQIDHIFPYRVREYVQYRYQKEFHWQLMPARVFRWLEKHFGWHLCITASSSDAA
ncbi:MAG: methyltransferase domain-containing protein [Terriglobia bacterium]